MGQSSNDTSPSPAPSVLQLIGGTPLVRISRITSHLNPRMEIFAKLERGNPGGSVKDRAACRMITDAEETGLLTRDKIILDSTSGNTGIAYAMIGSALGYPVLLALPANAGEERRSALQAYGARLLLTDPLAGTDGAQARVRELVAARPEAYFYPDQYNNPMNWKAHYTTTAGEIWRQTGGRVTHFVAGLGTTGIFVGTARRLKELNPAVRCVAVEPDGPLHGLEGLKHLATAAVPGIFDPSLAHRRTAVSTEEAYALVRRLAREEGLYAGVSSGAALATCLRLASELERGVIVTVFPDGGARYTSAPVWAGEGEER